MQNEKQNAGPRVSLSIDAGEIGWVLFKLRIGEHEFSQHVGDLTDLVGDLVRTTLQIVCGGFESRCVFDLEPGECRVDLTRSPERLQKPPRMVQGELGVSITFAFDNEDVTRKRAAKAYRAVCTVEEFGAAVLAEAEAILARDGVDAFEYRWDRAFPHKAVDALRQAMPTATY
jgi:hypothetical protein